MTQEVTQEAAFARGLLSQCGATELIAGRRNKESKMEGRRPGDPARRMLTEKQLLAIIPFSRSTLLRMREAGRFPQSHYISAKRMVWYEDEVRAWQDAVDDGQLPAERRRPRTKS